MALTIGKVTLTEVACALILGILTNLLVNKFHGKKTDAAGNDAPAETVSDETTSGDTDSER